MTTWPDCLPHLPLRHPRVRGQGREEVPASARALDSGKAQEMASVRALGAALAAVHISQDPVSSRQRCSARSSRSTPTTVGGGASKETS